MSEAYGLVGSAFVVFLILLVLATSSELRPGNGCFYINKVQEDLRYSKYQLVSTSGNSYIWITDSVGRYNVGDTLCVHEYKKFSRDSK